MTYHPLLYHPVPSLVASLKEKLLRLKALSGVFRMIQRVKSLRKGKGKIKSVDSLQLSQPCLNEKEKEKICSEGHCGRMRKYRRRPGETGGMGEERGRKRGGRGLRGKYSGMASGVAQIEQVGERLWVSISGLNEKDEPEYRRCGGGDRGKNREP